MSETASLPYACVRVAADPAGPPTTTELLTEIRLAARDASNCVPGLDDDLRVARLTFIRDTAAKLLTKAHPPATPDAVASAGELLPCPCCGSANVLEQRESDGDDLALYVECLDCGTASQRQYAYQGALEGVFLKIESELVTFWNRRATPAQTPREAALEIARDALTYGHEGLINLIKAERSKCTGDNWDFWNHLGEKLMAARKALTHPEARAKEGGEKVRVEWYSLDGTYTIQPDDRLSEGGELIPVPVQMVGFTASNRIYRRIQPEAGQPAQA